MNEIAEMEMRGEEKGRQGQEMRWYNRKRRDGGEERKGTEDQRT